MQSSASRQSRAQECGVNRMPDTTPGRRAAPAPAQCGLLRQHVHAMQPPPDNPHCTQAHSGRLRCTWLRQRRVRTSGCRRRRCRPRRGTAGGGRRRHHLDQGLAWHCMPDKCVNRLECTMHWALHCPQITCWSIVALLWHEHVSAHGQGQPFQLG